MDAVASGGVSALDAAELVAGVLSSPREAFGEDGTRHADRLTNALDTIAAREGISRDAVIGMLAEHALRRSTRGRAPVYVLHAGGDVGDILATVLGDLPGCAYAPPIWITDPLRKRLNTLPADARALVFDALLLAGAWARRPDAPNARLMTATGQVGRVSWLREWYPDATIVALVQDPRDAAVARTFARPDIRALSAPNLDDDAFMRRNCDRLVAFYRSAFSLEPAADLEPRYEGLVREPTEVLAEVAAALGIEVDTGALESVVARRQADGTLPTPATVESSAFETATLYQRDLVERRLAVYAKRLGYRTQRRGAAVRELGDVSVVLKKVSVTYRVYEQRRASMQEIVSRGFRPRRYRSIKAVRGVSLVARRGESIGLVGSNGSGKSTLLRAIAGLQPVTSGVARARCQPTLLGVGAVLRPALSGRRNIMLGGLALGMQRKDVEKLEDEIVEFSGLDDFIDLPMTAYSSGMRARLHFAIATAIAPEILLIDEALAVGDKDFKERSMRRILELQEQAGTIFLVTHNLSEVTRACSRAIWLDHGRVVMEGEAEEVVQAYTTNGADVDDVADADADEW